ncbi:hypothetical protein ACOY59_24195 [Enterobacter roggenkampii]|uniref:hypothetical protein n=1 Tax=Enterobacter roggenkampii TaxID=1812935 RepID=UPI0037401DC5
MKLFEMEGFLRGKCLPGDMKVNETNAEYMVRKFTELEQKLAESQREFRVADATIENLQMQVEKLAAENAGLKALARGWANATDDRLFEEHGEIFHDSIDACEEELKAVCPTTDAFLAEVRAQAHKEGAHFVANRMLAAWEAGFIDDTAKNAADIARMILTSTEFMADAPEGDFDRSFADGVLEDIAAQLRKGGATEERQSFLSDEDCQAFVKAFMKGAAQ